MKKIVGIVGLLSFILLSSCQTTGTESQTHPVWKYSDGEFMTPERKETFQSLRMYEVMVESFIDGDPERNMDNGYGNSHHKGDLKGVIKSLDYIKSMGFNSLWITPFFGVDGNSRLDATGYYPHDYFSVDPHFGTMDDARELVKQAHNRGMYIFFDAVFGHHKGTGPKPSPSGLKPLSAYKDNIGKPIFSENGKPVKATIDFYTEVATYWIKELGIDGWRLDVAQELTQDGHIFWEEIRRAVQDLVLDRTKAGEPWGTLGYMVGEVWKAPKDIAQITYGTEKNRGTWANFDFPGRYFLVQVFATQENDNSDETTGNVSLLDNIYGSHAAYPEWAIPQLFLGNHDVVRFGDLINRASTLGYGTENPDYWKRHKAAFNFIASYTGPIMTYYGEEIGDQLGAYGGGENYGKKITGDKASEWNVADDHVARTSARIEGINATLTPNEKDLKSYLTGLNTLRAQHKALSHGKRTNLWAEEGLYADLKTYGNEKILYIQNALPESGSLTLDLGAVKNLKVLYPKDAPQGIKTGNTYQFNLEGLAGAFYLVE